MGDISVTMKDVKAIMKNNLPVTGSSPSISTRAAVPAHKSLFYGRDALVHDLVAHLTNSTNGQKHTCILGAGGMGKTSTALAVMAHADVKIHYPDSQRV